MTSKFQLAFITVATTLAYLLLAIWGAGGFAAYFSRPPLVAVLIASLVMIVFALLSPGNISSGEHEDRSNRWVLAAFAAFGILSSFVPAYTDRINFLTIDGDLTRWIGFFLYTTGGALRLWPVFVLGRRFSGLVAIQSDHALVTTGVYAVIRHPSYLGLLINCLGWALSFRSTVGIVLMVFLMPPLLARISAEENLLRMQFGDEYEEYCARVRWRLFPGIF